MASKDTNQVTTTKSTLAHHDPTHCLAPGLFRSLKSGERQEGKRNLNLNIIYKYSNYEQIRFVGPEPLGVDDMRVLQGLVSLAGQESTTLSLSPEQGTDVQNRLRVLMEPEYDALTQKALMVKCRLSTLLTEIGMQKSGQIMKHVYRCIDRMSYVSVSVQSGKRRTIIHMMSSTVDETDGSLIIALNPLITKAIIGHQRYTKIDMAEVRATRTDPGRLIHQRLCGWINQGGKGKVTLDTVCEYIWTEENTNINTVKKRKNTARKALAELKSLGWSIEEYAVNKYLIGRPLLPKSDISVSEK